VILAELVFGSMVLLVGLGIFALITTIVRWRSQLWRVQRWRASKTLLCSSTWLVADVLTARS
jgi:hypothetical protein